MNTVINNPGSNSGNGDAAGMVIGILIVLVLVVLFFVYGLPAIRNTNPETPDTTNIQIDIPSPVQNQTNPPASN